AIQDDLPAGGRIETRQQSEQCAFSATRWAHYCGKLAFGDLQVDAFEDIHAVRAGIDGLGKRANLNQPSLYQPGWYDPRWRRLRIPGTRKLLSFHTKPVA